MSLSRIRWDIIMQSLSMASEGAWIGGGKVAFGFRASLILDFRAKR